MKTQEISVTGLTVGDVVVTGSRSGIPVKRITPCSQTTLRGVPKIHVNDTLCYDTIGTLEIIER